jgi:hypothetical protein
MITPVGFRGLWRSCGCGVCGSAHVCAAMCGEAKSKEGWSLRTLRSPSNARVSPWAAKQRGRHREGVPGRAEHPVCKNIQAGFTSRLDSLWTPWWSISMATS